MHNPPADSSSGVPPAPPALTADEWATRSASRGERKTLSIAPYQDALGLERYGQVVLLDTPEEQHAVAALCLYGQDFGFTQDDVESLGALLVVRAMPWEPGEFEAHLAKLLDLQTRIANLLPPRVAPGESP